MLKFRSLFLFFLMTLFFLPAISAEDESRYPILTYGPTQEVAKAKGVARAERIAKQSGKKFAIQNESYSQFSGGTLWKCRLDVSFYWAEDAPLPELKEEQSRYPILTYGPTQEVAKAKGVARAERIAKQSGKKFAIQNESYSKFSGGTLWKCRLDVYFYRGKNSSNDFFFASDQEQSLQSAHQCLLYDRSETQFLTGRYEQVTQVFSSGAETQTASYSVYLLDNQFNGYWIGENSSLYLTGLLQKEAQEETLSIRAFVQKEQSDSLSFSYQVSCSQDSPGLKISFRQDQNGVGKGQGLLRSDLYEAWNSHERPEDRLLAVASILLEAHHKGLDTLEDSEPLSFRPTEKIVHQWATSWPGNAHAYYALGEDKLLKKSFRVTEKSANITSFSGMKVSFAPKKENTLVIYCPQLKFKGTTYYVKGILELTVEKKSSSEIAQKYYGRFYQELQKIADIVSSETMEKAATLNQEVNELPR